jgi:class 3 adenylate cyclase/tetratricopeptide (TPR) repeat protein
MADSHEVQLARLRQSMATLESQRDEIGDDAIAPALSALKDQISALEARQFTKSGDTEERRIVTILFTDIVGSTSIAERMDPEDWRSTISAVHEMAGKIVDQNDGRVLQYLGDGLLAAFGTEVSSERDPERGIKAALQIIAELPALNLEPLLQMRAGVHTGLVVMGDLGSYAKREFTASGDAMNLAARLQSSAPANGVVISHDTYRYVRGLFDMTPQAPFKVRGRQEPLRTYLVHHAKTHPFRMVTRGVGGVKVPTIGREAEMRLLANQCQEAFRKKRSVWNQIKGEPGVGKTRLLQDVAESLELLPPAFEWLKTQAIEGDARRPYTLVRRMWFERFQIAVDSPVEEAEAKWVRGIESLLGAGADEETHVLGLLVGLPFEGSPFLRTLRHDPSQMKGRAFIISRELLTKLRQKDPVVLLIEDLQWADQASWEYLTHVVMHEGADDDEDQALIVLATTRPEWKPPAELLSHSNFHLMGLPALSESDCRTLVQELLQRTEEIPDDVVQVIVERAQGVPYFAEEMVNWLIDKGVINLHTEPWTFTLSLFDETLLPDTLQHLLTTRLGSLTDSQRRALESASIYGRNFWEDGLRYLGVEPGDELLEAVEQRGFIEAMPTSIFVGDREWRFHHDLMRDATYEMILKRNRPGMHKKAATWLESRADQAGRLPEFAGVLGDHFERAGELSEAADWYLRAGERAWSQGAVIESREFFDRTIELLPPADNERLWSVLLNRDKVLALLGEVENRRVDMDGLLEIAGEFDDPGRFAEAYYRSGVFMESLGDFREAVDAYEKAVDYAEEAENREVEMLAAALSVFPYFRLGEFSRAVKLADKALDGLDQMRDDSTRAKIMINVGLYYMEIGELSRAASLFERAIETNVRLGDKAGEAIGHINLGYIYMQLGMFAQAQPFLQKALAINEGLGALRAIVYTLLNLGLARCRVGDQVGGKAFLARAQAAMEPLGDTFAMAISHMYLGLCLESAMDFSAAIEEYSAALDIYKDTGLEGYLVDTKAGLARCKQSLGFQQEALEHTREVWAYLQENGSISLDFPILAYQTCASVFKAVGEDEQSAIAIEEGWNEMMSRADNISDASWRESFIENVPEHRELSALWNRQAGTPASKKREDEDGG